MNAFNSPAYDVARPTGHCALTGRAFVAGESYIATLIEDGDDLQRVDVCLEAWEQGRRPDHVFSDWKCVAPQADASKPRPFVDDEVLMNLLERLADADQPQRIAFRFVLALLLVRKKLLRYDRTDRRPAADVADGGAVDDLSGDDWWILTPKLDLSKGPLGKWDESRTVEVFDPHLDEAGIRAVTDQLGEILRAEL